MRACPPHPAFRCSHAACSSTKVVILALEHLNVWKKLNVTAFLATGIAGGAAEAMGEPYLNAAGTHYAALLGQPIMIYAANQAMLPRARRQTQMRGLTAPHPWKPCSRRATTWPTGRASLLSRPTSQPRSGSRFVDPGRTAINSVKDAKRQS
ncbi:DUF2000 family protein [Lichenihabitans sp. Uapishka_5]|uniref:DUF2000 family protein n=1 Tax=Lichenihabitans sp. Uapishka_5 TaxID=3037302 RepID=UPI0029E81135|nr:DUF2000 family protein [Lichenihabitans sp. Uapishka_5]MDX7953300.1 DUF2000 family protein [Lichenihabitans sp. Uapishka_5]